MISLSESEELINRVEEDDNFFKRVDSNLAFEWEKWLTSDYWKNWRNEIRKSQDRENAELLTYKSLELRSRIIWNVDAYKKGICDIEFLKKKNEENEKELQDVSLKDWKTIEDLRKEVKEVLDGDLIMAKNGYRNWKKDELIKEISRLNSEKKKLQNFKFDSEWARKEKNFLFQKLEQYLVNSQMSLDSFEGVVSKTNFPKPLIFGGLGLVALIIGTVVYKVRKNKFKR